jgi:hypothetical protein
MENYRLSTRDQGEDPVDSLRILSVDRVKTSMYNDLAEFLYERT